MEKVEDNTYNFALEHLLVDVDRLLVDHGEFRSEALAQALRQLFFIRSHTIWVLFEGAFEALEQIAEVDPLGGSRELLQDGIDFCAKLCIV